MRYAITTFLREMFCWHRWTSHMVNVSVESGSTNTVTLCFHQCPKCGKSKLVFIFANGGPPSP